jgi:branched-chain amino acid transport system substrate-binding protein
MKNTWIVTLLLLSLAPLAQAAEGKPVLIGLDLETGHKTSTSDDAIRMGVAIAAEEINAAGGVLGGRPLRLVERDNRSVPARGIDNLQELAVMPDLVAVFCGKFSPVVLEQLPMIHQLKLPLLDPWAAADGIIDNGYQPNYVFRLSLRDSWAMPAMTEQGQRQGLSKFALILPNTSWGRSSEAAAKRHFEKNRGILLVGTHWYNWGDKSLQKQYLDAQAKGAEAILLVANETEGSILIREIAALPADKRLPIFSHWGLTGGNFVEMAGELLPRLDFSVVQTYSFIGASGEKVEKVLAAVKRLHGIDNPRHIPAPVGLAHAYDLTHILALAINRAGSADRPAIRDALEQVERYEGLIKTYAPPFTPHSHEALSPEQVFMGRFEADGAIARIP